MRFMPRPALNVPAAPRSPLWLMAALLLTVLGSNAHASVFYNTRVVASTDGGNFTGFGVGPSINDKGKVAFVAQYANGNSISGLGPGDGAQRYRLGPAIAEPLVR